MCRLLGLEIKLCLIGRPIKERGSLRLYYFAPDYLIERVAMVLVQLDEERELKTVLQIAPNG